MSKNNSIGAIYPTHSATEEASKGVRISGFEMKKLSIVARDAHADEHIVG